MVAIFKEAWISLASHKLRSFLTILGIIIGVVAVVLMVAAGQVVRNNINDELSSLGANMIIITPSSSNRGGIQGGRGSRPSTTIKDAEAIKEIKNVSYVAPIVSSTEQIVRGSSNWNTSIIGSNLDYLEINDWQIEKGTNFTQRDLDSGATSILIGKTIVEKLFSDGVDPIGQDIRIKNIPFKVIGILAEKGAGMGGNDQDDTIIAPLKVVKTRLTRNHFPNIVSIVMVTVDEEENMVFVKKRITTLLQERHSIKEGDENDFDVINLTEMANKIQNVGFILSVLLASIASISLVVGSIGIMNMMLVSVSERTREIGIRKAVGAEDKSILIQFLMESILISLIGSMIGMVLGIIFSQIGGMIFDKDVPISVVTIVISVFVALTVGITSGIFPAIKATKLDPIEALRYQ